MLGHRLVKLVTEQQLLQAHCACLEGPPRDLDAWWQELCLCTVDFPRSPRGVAGGEQTQLDSVAYLKRGRGVLEKDVGLL